MLNEAIVEFENGPHWFRITSNESCMVRTITLLVRAESNAKVNGLFWIAIYCITEADHIWSMLVADMPREDPRIMTFDHAIEYLRRYTALFAEEQPEALRFSSHKQASRFSEKHLRRPANYRGSPWYPGNGYQPGSSR